MSGQHAGSADELPHQDDRPPDGTVSAPRAYLTLEFEAASFVSLASPP
jgi:hypothetical protein